MLQVSPQRLGPALLPTTYSWARRTSRTGSTLVSRRTLWSRKRERSKVSTDRLPALPSRESFLNLKVSCDLGRALRFLPSFPCHLLLPLTNYPPGNLANSLASTGTQVGSGQRWTVRLTGGPGRPCRPVKPRWPFRPLSPASPVSPLSPRGP